MAQWQWLPDLHQDFRLSPALHCLPHKKIESTSKIKIDTKLKVFIYMPVCVPRMYDGTCRGQQRASDPLESELASSCELSGVGTGN